jgi:hypothetical protein
MSRQKTAGIHAGRPSGLGKKKPIFCLMQWPLLSLFHAARTPSTRPDPEGGAQDVRRFPTEPWMASRKIPAMSPVAV